MEKVESIIGTSLDQSNDLAVYFKHDISLIERFNLKNQVTDGQINLFIESFYNNEPIRLGSSVKKLKDSDIKPIKFFWYLQKEKHDSFLVLHKSHDFRKVTVECPKKEDILLFDLSSEEIDKMLNYLAENKYELISDCLDKSIYLYNKTKKYYYCYKYIFNALLDSFIHYKEKTRKNKKKQKDKRSNI